MLQNSPFNPPNISPPLPQITPSPPPAPLQKPHQYPEQDNQQSSLPCPRCQSTNTKFCYYNNYNLSQPRHFCKSCRRYWTKGGALRNVPVGGGTRKNSKRSGDASPASAASNPKRSSPSVQLPKASPAPPEPPRSDLAAPLCPPLDKDHALLDINANGCSFNSILGSTGAQLGGLLQEIQGCSGVEGLELQSSTTLLPMPESFVPWSGEWSDLAIFKPSSGFQ